MRYWPLVTASSHQVGIMLSCAIQVVVLTASSCIAIHSNQYPAHTPFSTPNIQSTVIPEQPLSTPTLIQQAFEKGEISTEERILYLTYAIYEYDSLPPQFHSNIGWRGTMYVEEINDTMRSPTLCAFSSHVQEELRRLIPTDLICEK